MATNIFADFSTDKRAEEDGLWERYDESTEFLIARSGNKKYARRFSTLYRANQRLIDSKTEAGDAKAKEILVQVMAETILLGWRGDMVDAEGKNLPYSIENAKKLLNIDDFRRWVDGVAEDFNRYRTEQVAEVAGKSEA